MSKLTTDIFIPTSNRLDALKMCLESISKQTNKDFKILLVGLKKDQAIDDLLKSFNKLKIEYFIQKRPGLIVAANEALNKSTADIFIRIDDDVIVDDKWLENIIETFESDNEIGGITGPTIMSKEGLKSRDLTEILEKMRNSKNILLKLFYNLYCNYLYEGKLFEVSQFLKSGLFTLGSNHELSLKIKSQIEVSNLEACNLACRKKLLEKIDGFDEIFLEGLGDYHEADVAMKIKRLGFKLIFNPKAKLVHNVEVGAVAKSRPATYYRIQNFIIFYFRYFKIDSLDTLIKFSLNLIMQNCYYMFKFVSTGDFQQLKSIPGTFAGLYKVINS